MRTIEKRLRSAWFIPCLEIVFVICTGCWHDSNGASITDHKVEALVPVASGVITNASGGDYMDYGLYVFVEPPGYGDEDFLLVLRNISAKFIDLGSIRSGNISLHDSKGKEVRLALHSLPQSVAWKEATSLQICAIDFTNASFPLVLTLKANLGIPIYLSITNVVHLNSTR
jgi:hypothetical protein